MPVTFSDLYSVSGAELYGVQMLERDRGAAPGHNVAGARAEIDHAK